MINTINFIISPKELYSHMQSDHNIIIIDVRVYEDYHRGHIPNAIHIPEIFTYLPQGLTTQKEKTGFIHFFQKIFSDAGICKDEIVIFYEEKYTLKSPRGLTILKYLGYDETKIKILDGGFHLWFHENLPISTEQPLKIKKEFKVNIDTNFFVDYDEMLSIIEDDSIIVLDVRDKDEWMGISSSPYSINFAPKKGRLPNAIWIEWYEFITDDMLSVKSLDKIQRDLDKKNIKYNDKIVLYCFKGARLSNSYIALRKLGYENIRIYFAGWNEWCRKENAPIINEIENIDNPILQENILLKQNLDTLNLQYANLIDFNRYNKEALFAFNRDGEICSANDATYEKLPHIKHYKDIYPNYTINEIFNIIDNNQEKNLTIEKNGKYFSLQLRGSKDTNKIIVHTFETTEIYALNKTLDDKIQEAKHSKEMFSLLFDLAPILIDAFDRDGKCILWNKECHKIFGWTLDDINNSKNPMELFYPDVETQKRAKDTILYKKEKIFRQWHPVDKNGDILTV
ncbi:MAG: rhodanese-like domain-containing protein, partial [Arcobacteraceae bacterium]